MRSGKTAWTASPERVTSATVRPSSPSYGEERSEGDDEHRPADAGLDPRSGGETDQQEDDRLDDPEQTTPPSWPSSRTLPRMA